MKQVSNSDNVKTAYQKRQANIAEYIERIQNKLKQEQKGEVNWPHVGSLGHVEELIGQIDEFFG